MNRSIYSSKNFVSSVEKVVEEMFNKFSNASWVNSAYIRRDTL